MSASNAGPSGLTLDPNDPDDAKIMRRQQRVARQAGRDGLDRAAYTRGRADLEAAYDKGAMAAASKAAPAASGQGQGPARGRKGRSGGAPAGSPSPAASSGFDQFRSAGPGWSAFKPTSPARPPKRLADTGGFLAGVGLYMVVVIYIRYGAEGWKGWLSAKFLNKPMDGAGATGANGDKPKHKGGGTRAV